MANVNANSNANLDPVAIVKAISDAVHDSADRESALRNALETAFHKCGRKYNVMVCNLALRPEDDLQDVQIYESFTYGNLRFGVWVFRSGTFIRNGDGGYINWIFRENFRRYREDRTPDDDGNVVIFEPIR